MASNDLSKDEQNFIYFVKVCVDFIKLPLIDILTYCVKPADLNAKIKCSNLISGGKKLCPDQLKLIFPSPPLLPDYSTFDVTLLYTLIRNLCPSLTPTRGWGNEPLDTDTEIGDDVERLRLFRNSFAHGTFTKIPDNEFSTLWSNVKNVSQRIHTFTKNWSQCNYQEELLKIQSLKFGYDDRDRYKNLLETTINQWKQSECRDEQVILIKGAKEVICGETAHFHAEVKQTENSNWSVTWHKKIGDITRNINTRDEKYKGSTNRQLLIHSICKDDEAEYEAVISNGNNNFIRSNVIYLHALGEQPFFDNWKITTGTEGLTIHICYGVPEGSPSVLGVKWTKNGETLDLRSHKYFGGRLNDSYLTISCPTLEDKGKYLCTVTNAVGSVSRDVTLDIPIVNISTDSKAMFGLKTKITSAVFSFPTPDGAEWQNSDDGKTFYRIDISKPRYYGSSLNPESPLLVIPYATFDDMLHYRLFVWNKIGDQYSNTLYINVNGRPPNIMTNHQTCLKEHSLKLIGEVFPCDPKNVFWSKNGEEIDTSKSGGKYSELSIKDPSLTIFDVNEHDAGSYHLTASNAVGSTKSDVIVLDKPHINIERIENTDGSLIFKAMIESIPAAYIAQWKVKRKNEDTYTQVNSNAEEYKGTSNSLPHPALVIKQKELQGNMCFVIEVDNFVGSSVKEISCNEILKESCRTKGDVLFDIFKSKGSKIRFNDLRLRLIDSLDEKDLQNLKTSIEVLTPKGKEFRDVNSISDFINRLWDRGVFQERNVIIMQYLMRSLKRLDLEQLCVKYAKTCNRALCYYEDPHYIDKPKVFIHVVDNIENFTERDALLETVASIVNCTKTDINVIGLQPKESFLIIITMRQDLLSKLKRITPLKLRKLTKFNVDWIQIEDKIVNIDKDVYIRDISRRKEDDKGFVETNSSIAIFSKMDPESSGGTSLETKLELITSFCESHGFSVQKIVLDITEKLCELPKRALETIDMLWRSRNILANRKTAYIIVQGIQILGTGLALVGMVFPVVGICSKVVQLVVYFLKIIFKISEPNIKLMLDPKVNTNDIYDFAGLAERLKSINSYLNAADKNENADESSIQGIISNVDIHIGVDEIGNLKNRIEEMMCRGGDHLMTCLQYLTIFVRICTLRHSILFRYINYLTGKEYYQNTVHGLQGFIENERVDHQNFLSFFPLPTLDNASVVAAFDPSEHPELAAFLTEMRLPLQDLRNALNDRVFLIQPVVNSAVLLGRPNAFISDSVKFMTLSLASDNIHIKFKFTAIENSLNLFYIQSPLSGKYMYMKDNTYCKHGVMTNPPLNAQWKVVQVQEPEGEDDTISYFILSTKRWPNRFICLVGKDAIGLDDESYPNNDCLLKLVPPNGSPISVQRPVKGNLTEKAQEKPSKAPMRQSVVQRRVNALWVIMGFLKERQIKIENDIIQIEKYVLYERNEEFYFLNSSLESIATVLEVLSGDEFNENMMDGLQRVLVICFQLFKDDFLYCSILRQLLRMCGAIISCIWQMHGIADFICRHLKQEDEHRLKIQNDIRALQRFALILHEIERSENILERHISHMISESRICDELGCLANLKETSLIKNHPHLMVTSLKVGIIQLAVTWQKYAVAKYHCHSDLEAKQLRQIIQLQMQNEKLFFNKCKEKKLSTSSTRIVANMALFTSGCEIEENETPTRRKKVTGMLLVIIPQLKRLLLRDENN